MVWKKLYQLGELNRLQQNFAYHSSGRGGGGGRSGSSPSSLSDTDQHRMYVVETSSLLEGQQQGDVLDKEELQSKPLTMTTTRAIVGFCDVDCRPCKTDIILPRPYLSDVAVDPKYRRRGFARALVEAAEDFVLQQRRQQQQQTPRIGQDDQSSSSSVEISSNHISRNNDDDDIFDDYKNKTTSISPPSSSSSSVTPPLFLWIRVHETNEAARAMYMAMNYTVISKEIDMTDTQNPKRMVWTLRKELSYKQTTPQQQQQRSEHSSSSTTTTSSTSSSVTDETGTLTPTSYDGTTADKGADRITNGDEIRIQGMEDADFFVI